MTLKDGVSQPLFEQFRNFIAQQSGIFFDEKKIASLFQYLRERSLERSCTSYEEYYTLLLSEGPNSAEFKRLVELITINETLFFRNREHFSALRTQVLPKLVKEQRPLRIWSAGCSTGEEAYSIAITLHELLAPRIGWASGARLQTLPESVMPSILATDISERVLTHGRTGIYEGRSLQNVNPLLLQRYFILQGDGRYRVADEIRNMVEFRYFNLIKEPYPLEELQGMDIIFCENVMIYFQPESVRRLVNNFYETIKEGGYLFIGYSETLWKITDRFTLVLLPDTFIYRRDSAAPTSPSEAPRDSLQHELPAFARPGALPSSPPPYSPQPRSTAGKKAPFTSTTSSTATNQLPGNSAALQKTGLQAPGPKKGDGTPPSESVNPRSLGQEALHLGQYETALAHFQHVLASRPSLSVHLQTLCDIARVYANRGEHSRAIAQCRQALQLDTLCEEAHYLLATIYSQQGDMQAAVQEFRKTVYINSEAVLAYLQLASIYRDSRDTIQALREYKNANKILEKYPDDEIIGGLSVTLLRQTCQKHIQSLERG